MIWFITGTSTGFGRELVEIVLEKGDIAIATARRPSTLADLVAKYPPDRLLVLKLDVSQQQDIVDAFAAVKAKFGRLDVVVNNAGFASLGEVESVHDADMRAMFETNFWGMANVSREAVKFFREVNPAGVGGYLLQFSSTGGVRGPPGIAYYAASKFALQGFNESLASELDPAWNIKVTIVEIGAFVTGIVVKTPWAPANPAYNNPELPTFVMRNNWDHFVQLGDPRKGMEAVYKLASLAKPPLHFPLGKDAVATIRSHTSAMISETDEYESWSEALEKSG